MPLSHLHPVAIKILEKEQEKFLGIAPELDILNFLQHQNIMSLLQVMETKAWTYLVLEFGQRTLMKHINRAQVLLEDESHRFSHKFCKPCITATTERSNGHQGRQHDVGWHWLINFSLAATFVPGQMLTRFYKYLSAEVFQHCPYEGCQEEYVGCGHPAIPMVTRTLPFQYTAMWELKCNTIEGAYEMPSNLSPDLQEVIRLLLKVDPEERPTAEEILEQLWFPQGCGGYSHLQGTLPTALDWRILSVMNLIGLDIQDTRQSILL